MTRWIVEHLGPDVPLHFTAFHPDFKMLDVAPTPPATLTRARRDRAAPTACATRTPATCTTPTAAARRAPAAARCSSSATGTASAATTSPTTAAAGRAARRLPGRFDGPAGTWGARRLPVRIGGGMTSPTCECARRRSPAASTRARPRARATRSTRSSRRALAPGVRARDRVARRRSSSRTPATCTRARSPRARTHDSHRRATTVRRVVAARARAPRRRSTASPCRAPTSLRTPLGDVPIDADAARPGRRAARASPSTTRAHAGEHSLEVHLPFLQRTLRRVHGAAARRRRRDRRDDVAAVLDAVWGGPETLIVVSTDLSHYEPHDAATAHDDAHRRRRSSRAGSTRSAPVTTRAARSRCAGCCVAAPRHGLRPELLDRRTSGDTAGPRDRVVGYAAFAYADQALDVTGRARVARRRSRSTPSRDTLRTGERRLPTPDRPAPAARRAGRRVRDARTRRRPARLHRHAHRGAAARDQRRRTARLGGCVRRSPPARRRRGRLRRDAREGLGPVGARSRSRSRRAPRSSTALEPGVDGVVVERGDRRRRRSCLRCGPSCPIRTSSSTALWRKAGLRARVWDARVRVADLHDSRARRSRATAAAGSASTRSAPTAPIGTVDFDRMIGRDRVAKVRAAMEAAGVDIARLLRAEQRLVPHRRARFPPPTHARASAWRSVAVLRRRRRPRPQLFTAVPRRRPAPARSLEEWIAVETDAGAAGARRSRSAQGRSRSTTRRSRCGPRSAGARVCDASAVLGAREAHQDRGRAASASRPRSASTNRRCSGSGRSRSRASRRPPSRARSSTRSAEQGATANTVDPVFQVMPQVGRPAKPTYPTPDATGRARRPVTSSGSTPGINFEGYASDFGATWIVGRAPDAVERDQFDALARASSTACSTRCGRRDRRRSRARRRQGRRAHAVALVLLPGARHRHRQRRDAVRRHRPRPRLRRRARDAAGDGARASSRSSGTTGTPAIVPRRSSRSPTTATGASPEPATLDEGGAWLG